MENEEADEETGEISVQEMFRILRQEALNPKINKAKEAKIWLQILLAGIENKAWCGCTPMKVVKEKVAAVIDSLEKKLSYVV